MSDVEACVDPLIEERRLGSVQLVLDPDAPDESERPGSRQGELTRLFGEAGLESVEESLVSVGVEHPTFAEGYKVAALDADNRLNELQGATEHGMEAEEVRGTETGV